jgi:N-acetylmuramoyl-L-alanine amidase CwlA
LQAGKSGKGSFWEGPMQIDQAYAQLNIVQDFIPVGSSNRPARTLSATSITIHNTDNADMGANAAAHAKYQKGPDARRRQVSWHFTVDDTSVYQSLPTNEIGWHTATTVGNNSSIGIEICMNSDLNVPAAYQRAALLTAVIAFQNGIRVPDKIVQHNFWSGKDCPIILRHQPQGWQNFLTQIQQAYSGLSSTPAAAIGISSVADHHFTERKKGETAAPRTVMSKMARKSRS